ncbi:hypothetical protein C0Q70_03927 [Pomacea canaliculata]|uniref:Uncharacterized protein n=1 Tax=Pomacea canaliculata TaxID=400727 RepID=A0A2T7PU34_POMCA|nr:hypothetical protein C0Q70_03927 [Pomacea canaliculata]
MMMGDDDDDNDDDLQESSSSQPGCTRQKKLGRDLTTNFVLLRTNETKEAGIGEKNSGPQGTCVVNSYSSQKRSLCQTISQNGSDKSSQCLPTASPEVDDNANGIHRRPNGKHHIRNDADDPESRPLLISETTATSPTSSSSSPVSPTSPAVSSSLQGNNCSGRAAAAVRTVPRSLPVKNGSSQAYYQRVSESPTPSPLSANKGDSGVLETSLDDLAKRSPSCTVGERKTPPRFNDVSATAGVPLIRFCGLTQSDSSLSSADGNRNYNYGNQVEYSPPEWGLVSGGEHLNGLNSPYALTVVGQPHAVFLGMQINASKEKTSIVPTGCDSAFSKTSADNTEKHQCSDSPETKMVDALMSGPYPMSIGDSGNETNPCSTEAGSYGGESSRLRQQECSVNEQLFPEKCVGSGGSGNYNDVNICVSENDVPRRSDQNGVGVSASCSAEISGPTPESGNAKGTEDRTRVRD